MALTITPRGAVVINENGKIHFTGYLWMMNECGNYGLSRGRTSVLNGGTLHKSDRTGPLVYNGARTDMTEEKFLKITGWVPVTSLPPLRLENPLNRGEVK